LPGNQGCSATKIGVGTLLPPHNTPDLGLYVCAGGLDIQNFDKNSRFVVLVISVWEAWTFVWDWLAQGFEGVLGTRIGSLELNIGSLELAKMFIGYQASEKIGSLESEKSGP